MHTTKLYRDERGTANDFYKIRLETVNSPLIPPYARGPIVIRRVIGLMHGQDNGLASGREPDQYFPLAPDNSGQPGRLVDLCQRKNLADFGAQDTLANECRDLSEQ